MNYVDYIRYKIEKMLNKLDSYQISFFLILLNMKFLPIILFLFLVNAV